MPAQKSLETYGRPHVNEMKRGWPENKNAITLHISIKYRLIKNIDILNKTDPTRYFIC